MKVDVEERRRQVEVLEAALARPAMVSEARSGQRTAMQSVNRDTHWISQPRSVDRDTPRGQSTTWSVNRDKQWISQPRSVDRDTPRGQSTTWSVNGDTHCVSIDHGRSTATRPVVSQPRGQSTATRTACQSTTVGRPRHAPWSVNHVVSQRRHALRVNRPRSLNCDTHRADITEPRHNSAVCIAGPRHVVTQPRHTTVTEPRHRLQQLAARALNHKHLRRLRFPSTRINRPSYRAHFF